MNLINRIILIRVSHGEFITYRYVHYTFGICEFNNESSRKKSIEVFSKLLNIMPVFMILNW